MIFSYRFDELTTRIAELPILRRYHIARQFVKFALIGLFNTAVDFSVYFGLTRTVPFFSERKLLANVFAFLTAVIGAFLLNRTWTFRATSGRAAHQFVKFILVYIVGFLINEGTLYAAIMIIGAHDLLGKILGLFINFAWNFLASRFWAFKAPRVNGAGTQENVRE